MSIIEGQQVAPEVVAEAYNAIMDAFDDYYIDVTKALRMTERLEASWQNVKRKVAAAKQMCNRATFNHMNEAVVNMGRFIAYKKSQL